MSSYSIVMKPPFISPNVPIFKIFENKTLEIKEKKPLRMYSKPSLLEISYFCYFKGEYLLENDVYIHPLSPSTQYGLNVFERYRCLF